MAVKNTLIQRGNINWYPIIILLLVALLILVSGLYVSDRAGQNQTSPMVTSDTGTSQQQYSWRLVTSWPKNFPGLGAGPENFAKMVEVMSAGRLKIHVYGGGELVPALGVLDAVSTGSVEMGHTASYYHKGKIPAATFFTAVPFGNNLLEQNAWIYYGGGLQLWRELYAPFNVRPFPGGNTGMQMGGWFNKEINSAEDLQGLKMRIPGLAGEIFTRAGGSAIAIPGGELYTAMQTGVIDATEWVGPYNDRSFGLHEVATHYYYPGWQEPSAMVEFIVNLDAWHALPTDLQRIIDVATEAINANMAAEYIARNGSSLRDLIEAEGIIPKPFPADLLASLQDIALDYYQSEAEHDENFRRVYESYRRSQATTYEWLKMSEKAIFEYRQALEN